MSSPPAGAQSVNVKVNHFGVTRRFKLNLRDISINTFEDKVRGVGNSIIVSLLSPPLRTRLSC